MKSTIVFDTYWAFAGERQRVFFRKLAGEEFPWTKDPILSTCRFTNAYRAADRVSQYLIRNVIYAGDQSPTEAFFRILLFRLFNKIETWELLERNLDTVCWGEYSFDRYNDVFDKALYKGTRIYTAAYIMPSGKKAFGHSRKHANCLRLIETMMEDDLPRRICDATSMEQAFGLLRSYPMIGDFLAYQYVIDINYSTLTNFSEMEFVVPGPGARAGIRKCFRDLGSMTESDVIRYVAENQEAEFARRGLRFQTLWGRPLQLIDCQNLFCEVDKYARLAHPDVEGGNKRKRIKQRYRPNPTRIDYWFPPKWRLNRRIRQDQTCFQ
ncbi:MAG: hypothetical protein JW741_04300 [Sedimentisphaerales bacterium]|nr:hypothetical protein [Sedimentisphaerales bacterium]